MAAPPATVLAEALRAFDEAGAMASRDPAGAHARYQQAKAQLESLVQAGVHNGYLFYNIGNACLRLGEIGRAIVYYRRAERLIPGDDRLVENLEFARELRADRIEPAAASAVMRSLFFWHYATPLHGRARAALVLYVIFWSLLEAGLFIRPRPAVLAWVTRLAGVVLVVLAVSAAADVYAQRTITEGVLVANDVVMRKGNGEDYQPQFDHRFSEGVEFVLLEDRGDWLRIELPDGKTGWIKQSQAELI